MFPVADSQVSVAGEWEIGLPEKVALKNDYGLIVKSKARHHAIAAKLDRPVQFDGTPLVVQSVFSHIGCNH
jgi:calnexin